MSHPHSPATTASRRSSLTALFFAFLAAASLVTHACAATDAAPPHHPDSAHVFNGCHLSTLAYLARFEAEFPAEQGRPLILSLRNADGVVRSHTVAAVTWHGRWWCRDEYFGVFPLDLAVRAEPATDRLAAQSQRLIDRHIRELRRQGICPSPTAAPREMNLAERAQAVATAAALIPFPHTVYWIADDRGEVPVIFFRPDARQIAVYDPAHGTGVATCRLTDESRIVTLAAHGFGYRATHVRREVDRALASGALVAANDRVATLDR